MHKNSLPICVFCLIYIQLILLWIRRLSPLLNFLSEVSSQAQLSWLKRCLISLRYLSKVNDKSLHSLHTHIDNSWITFIFCSYHLTRKLCSTLMRPQGVLTDESVPRAVLEDVRRVIGHEVSATHSSLLHTPHSHTSLSPTHIRTHTYTHMCDMSEVCVCECMCVRV